MPSGAGPEGFVSFAMVGPNASTKELGSIFTGDFGFGAGATLITVGGARLGDCTGGPSVNAANAAAQTVNTTNGTANRRIDIPPSGVVRLSLPAVD